MSKYLWAGLVALFCAATASAADVKVSEAWARATAPGQDSASVQMVITSDKAGALVAGDSGIAKTVEIHTMVMEGNMMKMRAIEELLLPAKTAVSLGADGNHMMLIGLKKPLKAGDSVPFALTIKFADGSKATVKSQALVKPLETTNNQGHEHHH
ncbi:MAG: copper chaperone PCu(A)C [Nitrosomonadales bacterium]|nr:copper chaperone PCu(A)C [Nitrosomonadales bacterium]